MTVNQGYSAYRYLASKQLYLFLCLLFTRVPTLAREGPKIGRMPMPNIAGSLCPSRVLCKHILLVPRQKWVKSTSVLLVSSSPLVCG